MPGITIGAIRARQSELCLYEENSRNKAKREEKNKRKKLQTRSIQEVKCSQIDRGSEERNSGSGRGTEGANCQLVKCGIKGEGKWRGSQMGGCWIAKEGK